MKKCTCGQVSTQIQYIKMGKNLIGDTVIWKYVGCSYCAQPLVIPQMKVVKVANIEIK